MSEVLYPHRVFMDVLKRDIAAAVAVEREACAKIAEQAGIHHAYAEEVCDQIARRVRERAGNDK